MDLSSLNAKQLKALRKDVEKELSSRRAAEQKRAREELKEVASKYGFSLNELVGGSSAGKATRRTRAPVKYRHPDDPTKTWTGRGRKPLWIKAWESSGRSLDELEAA